MAGVFVGYCGEKDGYRIWIKNKNKVMLSRDIIFKSEDTVRRKLQLTIASASHSETEEKEANCEETLDPKEVKKHIERSGNEDSLNYERRPIRKPRYLDDYVLFAECSAPDSYKSAMALDEAEKWQYAMGEEIASLAENETWHLVELPEGKKVIENRWVLRVKIKADGSVDRFKARLVAKGYSQKPGIDYDETFSPVARFDTGRTILSIAASENLKLLQFDVKTAFLYGKLHEEIYMKQPEGYCDGTTRVCKLDRSLYGLKQAPRCWNKRFTDFIENQNMTCSTADSCLFIRIKTGKKLLIAIYVDDGLVAGTDNDDVLQFIHDLKKEFKVTFGPLDCYLGIQILRINCNTSSLSVPATNPSST